VLNVTLNVNLVFVLTGMWNVENLPCCLDGELCDQVENVADRPRTWRWPQEIAAFRRERGQDIVLAAAWRQGPQTILTRLLTWLLQLPLSVLSNWPCLLEVWRGFHKQNVLWKTEAVLRAPNQQRWRITRQYIHWIITWHSHSLLLSLRT